MGKEFNRRTYLFIGATLLFTGLVIIVVLAIIGSSPHSCNKNTDCNSGQYCTQGTCKSKNGQPCTNNTQCASAYCNNDDNVCANLPTIPPLPSSSSSSMTSSVVIVKKVESVIPKPPPPPPTNIKQPPVKVTVPKNNEIIDMVSYSTYTITLYKDGTLYRNNVKIASTLRPTSLASFYGHLLVVANGKIYALENDTLETKKWVFVPYDEILKEIYEHHGSIIRIGTDLYSEHLYVQTSRHLYIFSRNGLVEQISYPNSHRRVYGATLNDYIDLDIENNIAKVTGGQANSQIMYYVKDAVMDTNGRIHPLTVNRSKEEGYTGIRCIDWVPKYF